MKSLPKMHWMPRAPKDLVRCVQFVALHPWGNPADRARDIARGIRVLRANPRLNPIRSRRRQAGLEYRRHNVAQFVIVYVYFAPTDALPRGVVSIRAIRHANEKDVFCGVRERRAAYGASAQFTNLPRT